MTVPRQEYSLQEDTCDKCVHCTHKEDRFYFCEVTNEYIAEDYALDGNLCCDTFEQELDDHETEESGA